MSNPSFNDKRNSEAYTLLINRAISGDGDAFAELYEKNAIFIHYQTVQFLDRKDEVDDMVQEVALKMYGSIGKLKNPYGFKTWLVSIIRNACIDHNRKRWLSTGEDKDIADLGREADLRDEQSGVSTEEAVLQNEEQAVMLKAVESLPPQQRRCLMLYIYEDMKVKDVAAALGITKSTAGTNIMKAKANIKKYIENDDLLRGAFALSVARVVSTEQVFREVLYVKAGIADGSFAKAAMPVANPAGRALFAKAAVVVGLACATGVGAWIMLAQKIPGSELFTPEAASLPVWQPQAAIVFTGADTDKSEHVNPKFASIDLENGRVMSWKIVKVGSDTSAASGKGANIGSEGFAALAPGFYEVRWLVESDGYTTTVRRAFEISIQ